MSIILSVAFSRQISSLPSHTDPSLMVKRADKSIKYTRWKFFFQDHTALNRWKIVLRQDVATRHTEVEYRELSNKCVEVVWRSGVAYDNAQRLIDIAKKLQTE